MKKDEAFWKRKDIVIFAAAVITGLLLLTGLITMRGRKGADQYVTPMAPEAQPGNVTIQAKVMDQEYAKAGTGGEIPVGAALAYREEVPLYPRPTQSVKSTASLRLQPGQPASYVMESQVTGVRTNRNGSIWIILAWKNGSKWIEMYAPSLYFQVVPGARRIPFFKEIKLIWEEPE
jgi:hypothetical protein